MVLAPPTLLCALAAGGGAAPDAPYAGRELVVMVEEANFASWRPLVALAREFEADRPGLRVRLLDQGGAVGQRDKARFLLAGDWAMRRPSPGCSSSCSRRCACS